MSDAQAETEWPPCLFAQRALWAQSVTLQERWPYGPPGFHESCCVLHEGASYCDCKASDASDEEWGAN